MPSRGRRTISGFKNVISRDTADRYRGYIVVWFANAASMLLMNKPVSELTDSDFDYIYTKLQQEQFLEELRKRLKKGEEGGVEVCEWSPIPRTGNDDISLLSPCYAVEQIKNASLGRISIEKLQPALSLEFAEHVRTLMPRASDATRKSKVIGVTSDILALSIIGAVKTFAYRVRIGEGEKGGRRFEYGYVFIDVYNPSAVDMERLNAMCRTVTRSVIMGGGSTLALYVGVAATIVLNMDRRIYAKQLFADFNFVRIGSTQQKTMLNAFDVVNLLDLSRLLARLRIAKPVYSLVGSYPSEDDLRNRKEARTVRSFIEELARGVMMYYSTGNIEGLYRALRMLSPGSVIHEDAVKYLGEDRWSKIVDGLLQATLPQG